MILKVEAVVGIIANETDLGTVANDLGAHGHSGQMSMRKRLHNRVIDSQIL
jgi:hypothetical protein